MFTKVSAILSTAVLLAAVLYWQLDPAAHANPPVDLTVAFNWVTVGDPGNACDPQSFGCYGAVGYTYRIATHEVTNGQYVEFLNAKAASDPLGLYSTAMSGTFGGITRSGSPGSYTYGTIAGREHMPVASVTFFDALRFVNWIHNGQGSGDTETGAYTLLGGTPTPSNPLVVRNPGAWIFLASDEEWYKAAFYDASAGLFLDFPTPTGAAIVCSTPTAAPNTANCGNVIGGFPGNSTPVQSYSGTPGPNGTFDQGGNVQEWTEGDVGVLENRTMRGGGFSSPPEDLGAHDVSNLGYDDPWAESVRVGFRVASLDDGAGGVECGDGVCEGSENALTCGQDCPDVCGDGLCSVLEDPLSCASDCPDQCGDGLCSGVENTDNCWSDCGVCGDGICDPSENQSTCATDCAPICGDGVLEGHEQCEAGLPLDASCTSLGFDAGTLSCNFGTCAYDTSGCFDNSCKSRWSSCSQDSECCSGNCAWFRRCR